MEILRYTSELSSYRPVELGEAETLFLIRIAWGDSSAYKIFSHLKSESKGKAMAYKNVHKRVKRLDQLNLIEVEEKSKRNAIHYKLTTFGLFYILSKPVMYPENLLIKYRNNIILRVLLYPYFEENTVKNCGILLKLLLYQYLRECCYITLNAFRMGITNITRFNQWVAADLEWHAKSFAVKLGLMKYADDYIYLQPGMEGHFWFTIEKSQHLSNIPQLNMDIKQLLSKDKKFMQFLHSVAEDFNVEYKELLELTKSK